MSPAKRSSPRGIRLLIALLALGVALAACTSDEGDSGPVTTPALTEVSTTTTSTTVANQTTSTTQSSSITSAPPSTPTTAATTPQTTLELFVSPTGLTVIDNDSGAVVVLVAFGDDRATTVDLVDRALGAEGAIGDGFDECPNGQASVAEWPDLVLDFDLDDKLISWRLPQGSLLTDADGLGLGTPRSELSDELKATIEETSLGTEFGTRTTVFGVLSGPGENAVVQNLFSVDTCAFR